MRTFCLFLSAAVLATLPVSGQVAKDSVQRLIRDQSAPRQPFIAGEVSGDILYREAYRTGAAQPLAIKIRLQMPAKLYCMDAADFSYDLRNAIGQQIRLAPIRQGIGAALPPVAKIGPKGECPYWAVTEARFLLRLDEIFPNLQPGQYTLQMTFRPRDGSVPATQLPQIRFSIV